MLVRQKKLALKLLMSFEYVYTPSEIESGLFDIRDVKDYPVLYTAIIEDVDILVTGDKDFSDMVSPCVCRNTDAWIFLV